MAKVKALTGSAVKGLSVDKRDSVAGGENRHPTFATWSYAPIQSESAPCYSPLLSGYQEAHPSQYRAVDRPASRPSGHADAVVDTELCCRTASGKHLSDPPKGSPVHLSSSVNGSGNYGFHSSGNCCNIFVGR